MKHKIHVRGIRCYAFHGCMEEEARIGGTYLVDVGMDTDFTNAAANDELSETIDYCAVQRIVEEEMAIRSKLIEHVGQRIFARMCKEIKGIHQLRVEIHKLSPPIDGDTREVSIVIEG
ncbi:MAG: dihydroneopterin aldolase [Bacteroidetes bacterium]|nr:dihydroneopterin aldolase [Bacteroidota bacterium]MBM3425261.1 dihydroneopterin aldolase [Bacteroidota bacterium]